MPNALTRGFSAVADTVYTLKDTARCFFQLMHGAPMPDDQMRAEDQDQRREAVREQRRERWTGGQKVS
jgi:hypothetical protein